MSPHSVSRSPQRGRIPTMASCHCDKWPHLVSALALNGIIPEAYNNLITLFPPTGIQEPTSEEEAAASDGGSAKKASRREVRAEIVELVN